ncbi:hypothetical protein [Streptomyces albireticuli]|uniref:hypothetical protein n=1 Tax=Streptomyces albireticuli TaxID=1940 RepID=UPI00117C1D0E|nr:hypothetical protein [Streptomyces albireticuli]MCD9146165.1 hypothetical protein [Streptomyces albireticuli]MCD9166236.1 hypothetical protein [Streptomyces albireticuli]MCD9196555.1 hypothetical protein [Streptomyces albireticuli]
MFNFGTIVNESSDFIWISCPIAPESTLSGSDLGFSLSLAEVGVGHQGIIYLRAEGDHRIGELGTVAIEGCFIASSDRTSLEEDAAHRWTYVSPGTLDIHVRPDSSITISEDGREILTAVLVSPAELGNLTAVKLGNLPPDNSSQ